MIRRPLAFLCLSGAMTSVLIACGRAPASPSPDGPTSTADAPKGQEQHVLHWSYEGETGPDHWSELSPDYAACKSGNEQSPIDVHAPTGKAAPITFEYTASGGTVVNNGHTIQVNLPPGEKIRIGDATYDLVQFHFHTPSEHHVEGKTYPMELHLVHKDAAGKLAVVGVFIDEGESNPSLDDVWTSLPDKEGSEHALAAPLDPASLLPPDRKLYHYPGSLTTPGCSEGVSWNVLKAPIHASAEQVKKFRALFPMNARPIQSLKGRTIDG